jgi:hypothetical protein
MLKRLTIPALAAVLPLLTIGVVVAKEPVKSGIQVDDTIAYIFEPVNVNGEHAGEPHCLVCENGANPVAMVFARELSEPLTRLIAKLDAATTKSREQEMGSFVVFLNDQEAFGEQLKALAKKQSRKQLILSTHEPEPPEGFEVSQEADVTVVLYREFKVMANHAFRKGELSDAAVDKILADVPKILAK